MLSASQLTAQNLDQLGHRMLMVVEQKGNIKSEASDKVIDGWHDYFCYSRNTTLNN